MRRSLKLLVILPLALLIAGASALWWLAESPAGLRWAADRLQSASGGRLGLSGLSGSLLRGFTAQRVVYTQDTIRLELQALQVAWNPRALLSRTVEVQSLAVRQADFSIMPGNGSGSWPESLALPVGLRIDRIRIDELSVRVGADAPVQLAGILLSYAGGPDTHAVEALRIALPRASIEGRLVIGTQRGADGFAGTIDLRNREAGAWSDGRLPLVSATARVALAEQVQAVTDIDADLGPAGRAEGDARLQDGVAKVGLDVSGLDLRALHADLAVTALSGRIDTELQGDSQRLAAQLEQADLQIGVDATRRGDAVEIAQLAVLHRGASLSGHGRLELEGARAFAADLHFDDVDPSVLVDAPSARLDGTAQIEGRLGAPWSAAGRFELRNSSLRDIPLSGHGALTADARRVTTDGTVLHLGDNVLRVDGAFGIPGDSLIVSLELPALEAFDPRVKGSLNASGSVSGTVADPRIQLRFAGDSVSLGGILADTLSGEISGSAVEHSAALRARGSTFDAELTGGGGLREGGWRGAVDSFVNHGQYPMQLTAPARIEIGPEALRVEATEIEGLDGRFRMDHFVRRAGRIDTEGEFSGVRASLLLALAGVEAGGTTLRLGGSWRIATTPRLGGELRIARESGDIVLSGVAPVPVDVRELVVKGMLSDDRFNMTGHLASERLVRAQLTLSVRQPADSHLPVLSADSPLQGSLQLVLPSLQELDRLTGLDARFRGTGNLTLMVSGTLGDPQLRGAFEADDIRISALQQAVFLTGGHARVAFSERQVSTAALSIAGGAGRLQAAGQVPPGQAAPLPMLEWTASNFRLLGSPRLHLVLDGSGWLALQDGKPVARAELRATEALISLQPSQAPRLGDDVVIAGRAPARRQAPGDPPTMDAEFLFDLGDRFRLRDPGLDATLSGQVRVTSTRDGLRAEGTIGIRGTFTAYGQELNIENGRIMFDGPADNPYLDITAMRRNRLVDAGVRITGTAQSPNMQLVSEPPVSEIDKLSWLVLGRPAVDGNRADFAMLATAAEAMLAGSSGVPITTRVARRLDLDYVGVQSSDGQGDSVMLGRRISDRVYVFLQQGISAAHSALVVEYALTRNWRMRAVAGDISHVGLTWGRSFE